MKREPSPAASSLRAAALAITAVVLIAFATIAYSFYADYTAVAGSLGPNGRPTGISSNTVVQGTSATVYINATIPNDGLYPLAVGISCFPSNGTITVTCSNQEVTVSPGDVQTLRFRMDLVNLSLTEPNNLSVKANVTLAIEPFVTLVIGTRFVSAGGSGS